MDNNDPNRDHEHDPELIALEQRLAAWRPASGTLGHDRMLYDAGRAAVEAESRVQSWRLAAAALALLAAGLGGLLVRQQSLLAHERSLLAHERSQRLVLETTLAARTGPSKPAEPPETAPLPTETPVIEPLSPTSYFALTPRLAKGFSDLSLPDVELEPAPGRPTSGPSEPFSHPGPLRPRDVKRVLEF
jgi:hypothetical protein